MDSQEARPGFTAIAWQAQAWQRDAEGQKVSQRGAASIWQCHRPQGSLMCQPWCHSQSLTETCLFCRPVQLCGLYLKMRKRRHREVLCV